MATERTEEGPRLLYHEVVSKAHHDPEFRSRLLDSPKEALAELGAVVDDDLTVNVIESAPDEVTIALPHVDTELPRNTLETVTGGSGFVTILCDMCRLPPGVAPLPPVE